MNLNVPNDGALITNLADDALVEVPCLVVGTVPDFHETFVDEGNFDTVEAVRALYDVGFDGAVIPDHVPRMVDDTDWHHRARGFTIGYLRGVIDTVATDR
jgi:mannonate dehydratase